MQCWSGKELLGFELLLIKSHSVHINAAGFLYRGRGGGKRRTVWWCNNGVTLLYRVPPCTCSHTTHAVPNSLEKACLEAEKAHSLSIGAFWETVECNRAKDA